MTVLHFLIPLKAAALVTWAGMIIIKALNIKVVGNLIANLQYILCQNKNSTNGLDTWALNMDQVLWRKTAAIIFKTI